MTSTIKNFAFTLLCAVFGLSFFFSVYQTRENDRQPASAGSDVQQLRHKIKIYPTNNGEKTISFSDFSPNICADATSVELYFAADGVSVAGEPTTMQISGACAISTKNAAELAALTFPVAKILGEKPGNKTYTYEGYTATLTFTNMADEWPRTWVMTRAEFKNAAGESKSAAFRGPASNERPIVLQF